MDTLIELADRYQDALVARSEARAALEASDRVVPDLNDVLADTTAEQAGLDLLHHIERAALAQFEDMR